MSGRAAWIDALVTLDGWALADAELSTDRLQVRWARADDESAWAELRVTTPGHGRTAPRFRDLQVCDVHVRTHDGTPCPALDEVADGVVACIAARSDAEPHGGLVRWLGGQAVETDLTDAEAVHAQVPAILAKARANPKLKRLGAVPRVLKQSRVDGLLLQGNKALCEKVLGTGGPDLGRQPDSLVVRWILST